MPKIIENIKEQILDCGKQTLINKNYKELNIRDIAKQCGIGIGTFYNYFKNKDELVNEIFMGDWIKLSNNYKEKMYSDISIKNKLYYLYLDIDTFVENYMSIFYEIAMVKGSKDHGELHTDMMYLLLEETIAYERQKGNISSSLSDTILSKFIYNNLVMLSKEKFMTFEELYSSLNI